METLDLDLEPVERLPLEQFTEKAYLDYSMYVILDRALPHIGDGLKPVQRRIVYAMSELGLSAAAKYKKSARTVGDVLGKFHPHGDSACYEAMVLLAQSFSTRYPLVDGQGNWGSQDDPKSFAAMRYTEARLAPFAEILLGELAQGTVEWVANFDATLNEPALLPARLPNILLNGVSGIAVGMATDIPPHNLREVAAGAIRLLEDPKAGVEDICEHIKGPDFPTNAVVITPREELLAAYRTGAGSVRARARYEIEGREIVITALPYQVSGAKVLEQIAGQMEARKLPMVEDLRDESDHENPTRLVIVPRSGRADIEALMSHLFASTDLERSYRINFNVIGISGRPEVKGLRELLTEWLGFRVATVRRRLEFRLEKVRKRLNILEGLLQAYLNIDAVIAIIRAEDNPKPVLVRKLRVTEVQAEAILELKLRHLARLEEMKIRAEQEALYEERDSLDKLLASKRRLKVLVRKEIAADAERYGDPRRSQLRAAAPAQAMDEAALIPNEPVTVVLSQNGWVRAAKGHEVDPRSLNYRAGDGFLDAAAGRSNQSAVFFDSTGRAYTLPAHTLPSARGLGEPLTGRFNPPGGAVFVGVILGDPEQRCFLSTDGGYGFIARLGDLVTRNKAGKAVVTVPRGARMLPPRALNNGEGQAVAAATRMGYLLVTPLSEMPQLGRGKGTKFIGIPAAKLRDRAEHVVALQIVTPGASVTIHCGKKYKSIKAAELREYSGERGRRGRKLPRGYQKVERMEVLR